MTPVDPTEVAERVDALRERLRRCGGQDIRVVAVTKTFDAGAIDAVVAAGLRDVGENYAQEAVTKLAAVASEPVVHFVGRLQRCLLYTSPSPRDATLSRMPSSA